VLKKALSLHQTGKFAEAASLYRKLVSENPRNADALHLLGVLEFQRNNAVASLDYIDRAIAIKRNDAVFLANRANALVELKRFEEALTNYNEALALNPAFVEALYNRGTLLLKLGRFAEAVESYDRALEKKPDHADALNNRGGALHRLNRFDEALTSYARALAIKPDFPDALNNRGNALHVLMRLDQALTSYARALAIKPDFSGALYNRGNVLRDLNRFDEALASYDRALSIKPDYLDALYNRALVLQRLQRLEEALASCDQALAINPMHDYLPGLRLFLKTMICDWRGIDNDFSRIAKNIEAGHKASAPFAIAVSPLRGALQRRCAEIYIRDKYAPTVAYEKSPGPYKHDRIRLGYFSSDFHSHATAFLMAGLFERHDRSRFEVIAFSYGSQNKDPMRSRLEQAFDRFIEVGGLPDVEVAQLARKLEIDIAVDLKGFMQNGRPGIFTKRSAPIQVNYLGYPGTMGSEHFDYLIADATLIPQRLQSDYAEKIVYLPDSYQVNDEGRVIADRLFTRAECGLPEKGFVFCCFNNNYKILPGVFDVWMRLLKSVEGSILWLLEDNSAAVKNLKAEAQTRGIRPERLVFAKRMDMSDHLARHRLADLFLDTLPCNAHTTASDALWTGLPVLTCLGDTFAGRVAASLLSAIGLAELITPNVLEYEARALRLASNREVLLSLRRKLAANRLTSPLFDTVAFTKQIEAAYFTMWQRHLAGNPREHIHVAR